MPDPCADLSKSTTNSSDVAVIAAKKKNTNAPQNTLAVRLFVDLEASVDFAVV